METRLGWLRLNGNQLKLLALIFMTIDHIGAYLLPQYFCLRMIGRLAMPIFAWMIAEGCRYTRNKSKYLLTMAAFAAICQVVYLVFKNSLYQCILVTFSMSILLIYTVDYASKKKTPLSLVLLGALVCAVCYICVFLPGDLPGTDFRVDYGFFGVLLPVMIYLGRSKQEKLLLAAVGLVALGQEYGYPQWLALLALPLLSVYDGTRGKLPMKYLFYIYYPLHLVVIYAIAMLIR